MNYGCIGEHLPHSFSKEIHERIASYDYQLCEISREAFADFMQRRDFQAVNVTIPYKQDVIPYLHQISDTAKAIGAVNTIVNRDGLLYGYNTDFGGMKAMIEKMGSSLAGKKVMILGTGGTSKTARAVAKSLGASEIYRVSRSKREDALSYEEAYRLHSDAEAIINTTPSGMFPNTGGIPVELERFPRLSDVIDAVYNPLSTNLVRQAQRQGIRAQGGLYMLVAQAVLAAEIFTGKHYDAQIIDNIYNEIFCRKQNIVLIGMPGSGKTTIGTLLAKRMGREMIDTDRLIVENSGMEITDIFERYGQEHFRNLEAEAVREAAKRSGCIIATGGGAVLRGENVDALQMNGRLYFLNRPLEQLVPTGDRPLSDSQEKMKQLYRERYPIYCAATDEEIPVDGIAEHAAEMIESRHIR